MYRQLVILIFIMLVNCTIDSPREELRFEARIMATDICGNYPQSQCYRQALRWFFKINRDCSKAI